MADTKLSVELELQIKKATSQLTKFSKKAEKALSNSTTKSDGFSKSLSKIGKTVVPAMIAAFAFDKIISGFSAVINLASDFEENINKVQAVFGEAGDEMVEFTSNAAKQFGISTGKALELVGMVGSVTSAMEFGTDETAKWAKDILLLATNIGSFNNLPTEDVVRKITSALTGEREGLKSLGIVVNETRLKQEAASRGITGVLSTQTKATLTLALIQRDMAAAQGDFAKTAEQFANKTKTLFAQVENLARKLGEFLLPAITSVLGPIGKVLGFFEDLGKTRLEKLIDSVSRLGDASQLKISIAKIQATKNIREFSKDLDDFNKKNEKNLGLVFSTKNQEGVKKELDKISNKMTNIGSSAALITREREDLRVSLEKANELYKETPKWQGKSKDILSNINILSRKINGKTSQLIDLYKDAEGLEKRADLLSEGAISIDKLIESQKTLNDLQKTGGKTPEQIEEELQLNRTAKELEEERALEALEDEQFRNDRAIESIKDRNATEADLNQMFRDSEERAKELAALSDFDRAQIAIENFVEDLAKKAEALTEFFGAAQSFTNIFSNFADKNRKRETKKEIKKIQDAADRERKQLDGQLKMGLISKIAFDTRMKEIDDREKVQTENKKAELNKRSAMEKANAIFGALSDTFAGAVAAFKALAGIPIVGPFLGAAAAAAATIFGLKNVAAIRATELAEGGLITRPTLAIAGEAGDEVFAPKDSFIDFANSLIRNGELDFAGGSRASSELIERLKIQEIQSDAILNELVGVQDAVRTLELTAGPEGIRMAAEEGKRLLDN